jgi:hypothetical protein
MFEEIGGRRAAAGVGGEHGAEEGAEGGFKVGEAGGAGIPCGSVKGESGLEQLDV